MENARDVAIRRLARHFPYNLSFFLLLASTRIVDSVTYERGGSCSLLLPGGGDREEEEDDIRFLASYGFRGNRKKKNRS